MTKKDFKNSGLFLANTECLDVGRYSTKFYGHVKDEITGLTTPFVVQIDYRAIPPEVEKGLEDYVLPNGQKFWECVNDVRRGFQLRETVLPLKTQRYALQAALRNGHKGCKHCSPTGLYCFKKQTCLQNYSRCPDFEVDDLRWTT